MQRERILQPDPFAERDRDMPAVALAAIVANRASLERQPRKNHHAVMSFPAVERDVFIAEPLEALARKAVVGAFGLLQT